MYIIIYINYVLVKPEESIVSSGTKVRDCSDP